MLRNYLKIALRNVRRQSGYAFINVTGLAVGIAACLLIALYVRDELSYDRFHDDADDIHRIVSDWGNFSVPATNWRFVERFMTDYPHVGTAFLIPANVLVAHREQRFEEEGVYFANPAVFDVFTVEVMRGERADLLAQPYTTIIAAPVAEKYFGDDDPIGKTLTLDNQLEVEVVGVMEAWPDNSHIRPAFLMSWATLVAAFDYGEMSGWGNNSLYTYLRLPDGLSAEALEAEFPTFIERHAGDDWNGSELSLQPLTSIHLHSHHNAEISTNSRAAYVYIFSGIAFVILLIAGINFMNLATARATERAKEVGVRKTVGARRQQLIRQFMVESMLMAGLGAVASIALTAAALPVFRTLTGKTLSVADFLNVETVLIFVGITLLVGILAGSYPAFYLARFDPSGVLRGRGRNAGRGGTLRKGLVVGQFAISMSLIVGTLVAYSQLGYLQNASLGFDQEQILTVPMGGNYMQALEREQQYRAFKQTLLDQPGIQYVTQSSESLPSELLDGDGLLFAGADSMAAIRMVAVGHDFFEALGVEMVAGRSFTLGRAADSSAFMLNKTAFQLLAEEYPESLPVEQAIGKDIEGTAGEGEVIGVVEDFNMATLHEQIEPVAFFMRPQRYDTYVLRVSTDDVGRTLAAVEDTWAQFFPEWPFTYRFADEAFDARYRAEERLGQIFSVFAGLAIFVACLGLFGLAAFTAQQRTKEIGVRKALGASVASIVALLSADLLRLVVLAFVVAAPAAYFAMEAWLDGFAYRIDLGVGIFLLAGSLALVVALVTVSVQSIRAALTDPVQALRTE